LPDLEGLSMLVAVETSDLVGSTQLSPAQVSDVLARLKNEFSDISKAGQGRAEFYRGDGFQVMYTEPSAAVKYVIMTKLVLRFSLPAAVDVTQSLAVGELDSFDGPLSEKMAEVFVQSGRQLDSQTKGEIAMHPSLLNKDFLLATRFVNRVIAQLTNKQAETLYWYIKMDYPEQQQVADKLNMTRQNANTHLQRANTDLVRAYIDRFAAIIKEHIE